MSYVETLSDDTFTTYYYDTNGNRTHRCTPQTGCIKLHYNAQDQLTKYGTNVYTYTLNGELKTKGGQHNYINILIKYCITY
jgi:hypothetical protein